MAAGYDPYWHRPRRLCLCDPRGAAGAGFVGNAMRSLIPIAALIVLLFGPLKANAQSDKARNQDLLFLMGAGLAVPGMAAYCEKFIVKNPALIDAAQRWNQRHLKILEKVVSGIKEAGGLSADEKRRLDVAAYKSLSKEIEEESDKIGFCRDAARLIDAGVLDFQNRSDTAAALSRLGITSQ